MEYQKEALSYVLREDEDTDCKTASYGSAAMVFEETASHKPRKSGHLDQAVGSRS